MEKYQVYRDSQGDLSIRFKGKTYPFAYSDMRDMINPIEKMIKNTPDIFACIEDSGPENGVEELFPNGFNENNFVAEFTAKDFQ